MHVGALELAMIQIIFRGENASGGFDAKRPLVDPAAEGREFRAKVPM